MPTSADSEQLQDLVVSFVRAFGLHRPDRTPCGAPVSVSEAHALMELACGAALSQGDLTACLRLEKSSVSRLVAQLERQGHLRRTRDARDGRVLRLSLTAAGMALAAHFARARAAKFMRLVAAIPEGDRDRVVDGLTILVRALGDQATVMEDPDDHTQQTHPALDYRRSSPWHDRLAGATGGRGSGSHPRGGDEHTEPHSALYGPGDAAYQGVGAQSSR